MSLSLFKGGWPDVYWAQYEYYQGVKGLKNDILPYSNVIAYNSDPKTSTPFAVDDLDLQYTLTTVTMLTTCSRTLARSDAPFDENYYIGPR